MQQKLNFSTHAYLLALVVLVIYYPANFSSFNSVDDMGMLQFLENCDAFTFKSIFIPGAGSYYRPLLLTSFVIDKYVWGLEGSFMHLENVVFHLANTLLVYAVARRAAMHLPPMSRLVPFVAALFFAIHPLNTEAVNWISGRTDLLACFFLLFTMFLLLRWPTNRLQSVAAALCMLVACLAKETSIFFLPAALVFPYFIPGPATSPDSIVTTFRRSWFHCLAFCSIGVSYFAFRMVAFSHGDSGITQVITHVGGPESAGVLASTRQVLKAVGFYAKKLLMPFPLNFGIIHVADYYLPIGLLVLAWVVWLLTRRSLSAFFVICAGAVGTSALIIPLLHFTWTPIAERYMYIPSAFFIIGFSITVGKFVQKEARHRTGLVVLMSCLACIALYGTVSRNLLWQDNLALFQDTVRKSPDFIPAQNEVASALQAKGNRNGATAIYKSFNNLNGLVNAQYGLKNKACAFMDEGNFPEARKILMELQANPGKHEVSILLLMLQLHKMQVDSKKETIKEAYVESVAALTRLIELTGDPFYSYRLGLVHMQVGERKKAIAAFATVTRTASPAVYYFKAAKKLANDLAM